MGDKEMYLTLRDDLERISLQLGALINMINTIHNGLIGEHMEEQAVDSIDCIGFCVEGIKRMIDDCLMQIREKLQQ